jgi:hypothetical protein
MGEGKRRRRGALAGITAGALGVAVAGLSHCGHFQAKGDKSRRGKAHTRLLVVPSNSAINHFLLVIPRPAFFSNFDLRQRNVERT